MLQNVIVNGLFANSKNLPFQRPLFSAALQIAPWPDTQSSCMCEVKLSTVLQSDWLPYMLSHKTIDLKESMFLAPLFSNASFLMHQLLTIICHTVSHLAIILDDSMPCGHSACPDIKVSTWISSTSTVLGCIIDHINDSKGKVSYRQVTNDNINKIILLLVFKFRELFSL